MGLFKRKPFRSFYVVEIFSMNSTKVTKVEVPRHWGYDYYLAEMKRREKRMFTRYVLSPTAFALFGAPGLNGKGFTTETLTQQTR